MILEHLLLINLKPDLGIAFILRAGIGILQVIWTSFVLVYIHKPMYSATKWIDVDCTGDCKLGAIWVQQSIIDSANLLELGSVALPKFAMLFRLHDIGEQAIGQVWCSTIREFFDFFGIKLFLRLDASLDNFVFIDRIIVILQLWLVIVQVIITIFSQILVNVFLNLFNLLIRIVVGESHFAFSIQVWELALSIHHELTLKEAIISVIGRLSILLSQLLELFLNAVGSFNLVPLVATVSAAPFDDVNDWKEDLEDYDSSDEHWESIKHRKFARINIILIFTFSKA